jgi:ion channel-forming bestrophin family protein
MLFNAHGLRYILRKRKVKGARMAIMQEKNLEREAERPATSPQPNINGSADSLEQSNGYRHSLSMFVHPFTRMHKIPVFKRVWVYLTIMALYDAFVGWVTQQGMPPALIHEAGNAAYVGAVFGLLLVFRTNSAYDRWWEGRRLWGQLVNESRNLAMKVQAFVNVPESEKVLIGEQIVSFAYALKHHLRDSRPAKNLPGVTPIVMIPQSYHLPAQVALQIHETVRRWQKRQNIDVHMIQLLDKHLAGFMDVSGACERIKTTPLAVSYRAFMRQGIALNLLLLPWYLGTQLEFWFSLPLVLVAAYYLIGLELIAEAIEDPFGVDGDDLPLDEICANLQKVVTEIMSADCKSGPEPDFDPLKYTSTYKIIERDPLKGSNE